MAEHDFAGGKFCRWCGAVQHEQMTATCIERAEAEPLLAPEPRRRQMACEDSDAISARIVELQAERSASLNREVA